MLACAPVTLKRRNEKQNMKKTSKIFIVLVMCMLLLVSCQNTEEAEHILMKNIRTEFMVVMFAGTFSFEFEMYQAENGLLIARFYEGPETQNRLDIVNGILQCPLRRGDNPILFNGRSLEVRDFIDTPLEVWDFTGTFDIHVQTAIEGTRFGVVGRCPCNLEEEEE